MAKKRSVKIYGQSGYKYQKTATIMLKGKFRKYFEVVELSLLGIMRKQRKEKSPARNEPCRANC